MASIVTVLGCLLAPLSLRIDAKLIQAAAGTPANSVTLLTIAPIAQSLEPGQAITIRVRGSREYPALVAVTPRDAALTHDGASAAAGPSRRTSATAGEARVAIDLTRGSPFPASSGETALPVTVTSTYHLVSVNLSGLWSRGRRS